MNYYMYMCPNCKKVFKVKGANAHVKCNNCADEALISLEIEYELWNSYEREERERIIIQKFSEHRQNRVNKSSNSGDNLEDESYYMYVCTNCNKAFRVRGKNKLVRCTSCRGNLECTDKSEEAWKNLTLHEREEYYKKTNNNNEALSETSATTEKIEVLRNGQDEVSGVEENPAQNQTDNERERRTSFFNDIEINGIENQSREATKDYQPSVNNDIQGEENETRRNKKELERTIKSENKEIISKYAFFSNIRVLMVLLAIVTVVLGISFKYMDGFSAQKNLFLKKNSIKRQFCDWYNDAQESIWKNSIVEEYGITEIKGTIKDLKLYDKKKCVIIFNLNIECDKTSYDSSYVAESDFSSALSDTLTTKRTSEDKLVFDGYEIYLIGGVYVNNSLIDVRGFESTISESDTGYIYDGYNNSGTIVSMMVPLIGACIAVFIIIGKKKRKITSLIYEIDGLYKIIVRKNKIRIALSIMAGIVLAAVCMLPGYIYINNQKATYSEAEALLNSNNYDEAYSKFVDVYGYRDSAYLVGILESMITGDYETALSDLAENTQYSALYNNAVEMKNDYYYTKAEKSLGEKDYLTANKYFTMAGDYKDSKEKTAELSNYVVYYDALNSGRTSLGNALNKLKTLPRDFLDVGQLVDDYSKYISCIKEYGDSSGYIVEWFMVRDFILKDNKVCLKAEFWPEIELKKCNDGSEYQFYGDWDQYGRKVYISPNKVKIVENGKENILKTDGTCEKNIPIAAKNGGGGSSSSGVCPNCGGTGYVRFYYGDSDLEAILSGHDPYELGVCPMCHGKGR